MTRPLVRVLGLLEILQSGGTHRLAELSTRLGVDARTVRRYAAHLVDLGIPVESERGRYGGYRLGSGFRMPPLLLTDDEALAVLLGLAAGRRDLAGASALAKVLRVLPEASRARFEALLGSADLREFGRPSSVVATDTGILLAVAEAAGARTPLRVRYADRDGRASHRILLPSGLVARGGRWYLSAADSLSGEVRTFRLDRMRSADPQDGAFPARPGFDPADAVRSGLAQTPWRYAVSLRVEATADYVADRLPQGLATITELRRGDEGWQPGSMEGWLRVSLRAERLGWLPPLLAGLDRPFIVDDPAELRVEVGRLASRLADIAESGASPRPR
ncbi:MAG TPA: WYL domain-containing protein [Pseudolysinimonas sp.]|nr:WYL domain-containing protein [Pseudolysinimonas sp.]